MSQMRKYSPAPPTKIQGVIEIKTIEKKITGEFYVCEKCGYDKGFHVSFNPEKSEFTIILICPQCGQKYRVGWSVKL